MENSSRTHPIVVLGRAELAASMDHGTYLRAVEAAFLSYARGEASVPAPMHIAAEDGGFHAKGALVVLERPYVAVKVNGNFPGNPRLGLPTIQGAVLLFDGERGTLLAVLDSIEITSMRTAAASALAARHLARREAASIAILGCGVQGRAQLAAIRQVLPLDRAVAWDIDAGKARAFAKEMSDLLDLAVKPVADARAAASQSEVVVTATAAKAPLLRRADVSPGTFIAAVGADAPHKSELGPDLFAGTKVVTDLTSQAAVMGDLHHAIEAGIATAASVHAELGEIVAGRKPGRIGADEITIFDSTGVAIQDVAAAAWAYERARERGGARTVEL